MPTRDLAAIGKPFSQAYAMIPAFLRKLGCYLNTFPLQKTQPNKKLTMRLKKIEIAKFRNFENVIINLEKNDFPPIFPVASNNGGGKSTLLQFVFTLLHCFMDEDKKVYLQNLLADIEVVTAESPLASFIVESDGVDYELKFWLEPVDSVFGNFDLFPNFERAQRQLAVEPPNQNHRNAFFHFRDDVNKSLNVTTQLSKGLEWASSFISNDDEKILLRRAQESVNIRDYSELVNAIYDNAENPCHIGQEIKARHASLQSSAAKLKNQLNSQNLSYITHLCNEQSVLLLQTQIPDDQLIELTQKIYLAAPGSQIFLFLAQSDKQKIFNSFTDKDSTSQSYDSSVIEAKQQIPNFSTYDFAAADLILTAFNQAFEKDLKVKIKTKQYGTHYDELAAELNNFLEGKEIAADESLKSVIFSLKDSGKILKPEDLSHGELKKLSIYIWLKYIVGEDAIVLMDEIDIALHPKWQYQISKDLTEWSANSQFLLATHSPQILSASYYKNIIKLDNTNNKTSVIRLQKPPTDRDINGTVTEVMGAPDFPEALKQLHKQYRKFIDNGQVGSDEAKALKDQILQHESEDSAFFQDIRFDLDLM
ncbi:MAG: putative ATP-dependent endonuclease of OLD family [Phenylobacterium sp.]|jgi:predicted ATP-dependent endonuclease of OLD family